MPYGLHDKDIEALVNILMANPKVNEVILFGSRAKGNFLPGSDVDIAIKGEGLKLKDISQALLSIDDLYLPYKIDLIIYERIKEPALLKHIEEKGISLFLREKPMTTI